MSTGLAGPARWSSGLALALAVHVAIAAALIAHWRGNRERLTGAPAILVDFAPAPAAPAVTPTALPHGPPRPQQAAAAQVTPKSVPQKQISDEPSPAPQKSKTVELKPAPAQTTDILPLPRPTQIRKTEKAAPRRPSRASAPSPSLHQARRAVARAPGASTPDPAALPNWKSSLLARLERYKRYPAEAQARREEGVAQLAFSVDRSGGVHHVRIVRTSGSALLDHATLELVERAQPLPPPPPELGRNSVSVVVPIRYHIH